MILDKPRLAKVAALTCVLANAAICEAQARNAPREFPLAGVIETSIADGLALRKAPPTATAFSYQLAERICGLGNGTEFVATEQTYIANGEIWFRIQTTVIVELGPSPCPARTVQGWLVAKTKETWVVTILRQGISLPSRPPRSSEPGDPSTEQENEAEKIKLFADYALLLLGTLLAVCVIGIQRIRSIHPKKWFSLYLLFEFVVLATINVVILATLMDQLVVVDEPNLMFVLFRVILGTEGGVALLGFLLSVIFLRFMSFTKEA